jgi:hypothetical protein
MRRLRQIAVASLVWATATSMLMASTPFVVCRCPNGDIKPFCFVSTFTKSSSCCNDACCSESGEGCCSKSRPDTKSCCAQKNTSDNDPGKRSDAKNSAEGPAFVKASCQKTLVQVKGSSLDRPETKLGQTSPESVNPLIGAVCGNSVRPSVPRSAVWRVDRLPPPTDLVTSLQRLTI